MNTKNKNRRKKALVMAGILIIIILIISFFVNKQNSGPRVISFNVELPDLSKPIIVANAFKLTKIEVWGVPEATSTKKTNIKIGEMNLVETNNEGDQTWTLESSKDPLVLSEVFAQGFVEGGVKANKVSLPYKGSAQLTSRLWPTPIQAVITGTVKDIGSKSLSMGVASPAPAAITVFFGGSMKVVDSKGKPTAISKVRSNSVIIVTGNYTNENTFLATEIEIGG